MRFPRFILLALIVGGCADVPTESVPVRFPPAAPKVGRWIVKSDKPIGEHIGRNLYRVTGEAPDGAVADVTLRVHSFWSTPGVQRIKSWTVTGRAVRIGILDTGVNPHPDLTVVKRLDATGEGPDDLNGHGTHVAGIAAGDKTGVNPNAEIVSAKCFNADGSGSLSDVLRALYWLIDSTDVEVVNCSFGGYFPYSELFHQAFRDLAAKATVVASSGNEEMDIHGYERETAGVVQPAVYPEVITVSAMSEYDGLPGGLGGTRYVGAIYECPDDARAPYSNYCTHGKRLMAAPGTHILSTASVGGYVAYTGTSMAAPHVAGAASLMRSVEPSSDVASRLFEQSQPHWYWRPQTGSKYEEPLVYVDSFRAHPPVALSAPGDFRVVRLDNYTLRASWSGSFEGVAIYAQLSNRLTQHLYNAYGVNSITFPQGEFRRPAKVYARAFEWHSTSPVSRSVTVK